MIWYIHPARVRRSLTSPPHPIQHWGTVRPGFAGGLDDQDGPHPRLSTPWRRGGHAGVWRSGGGRTPVGRGGAIRGDRGPTRRRVERPSLSVPGQGDPPDRVDRHALGPDRLV